MRYDFRGADSERGWRVARSAHGNRRVPAHPDDFKEEGVGLETFEDAYEHARSLAREWGMEVRYGESDDEALELVLYHWPWRRMTPAATWERLVGDQTAHAFLVMSGTNDPEVAVANYLEAVKERKHFHPLYYAPARIDAQRKLVAHIKRQRRMGKMKKR